MEIMDKDINCLNFKGLFGYIEQRFGNASLEKLFKNALKDKAYFIQNKNDPALIEPVTLEHLRDESYWISNELSLALLASIKTVVPGHNPEHTAGQGAILETLSKRDLFFSRIIGPKALAKRAARINEKFNRTKKVTVTLLEDTGAIMSLVYKPGFKVTREVCQWNLGIYTGLAKASGARAVLVNETKCIHENDSHCEIKIQWQIPGLFKRLYLWVLKLLTRDLVAEYEKTVNQRDKLIEKLKDSEQQYKMLIENSAEGICIIQDGRISYTNTRFFNIIPSSTGRMDQNQLLNLFHPDDRTGLINRLTSDGSDKASEERLVARLLQENSNPRFITFTFSQIQWQGRIACLVSARDITNQKRTQELLIQSEKMMSIGGLAAGMAHEINNPLAGMMQNAQVALNRLSKHLPANKNAAQEAGISLDALHAYMEKRDIIRILEHINDAGRHAAAIVSNMLNFSKQRNETPQPQDLAQILENAIELAKNDWDLNHTYDFRKISITREYDASIPKVPCEAGKIQQVIFNTLKNAAEAMHDDVGMNFNPALCLRLSRENKMARIDIKDNGPGMAEDVRKRVFEPFFTTKGVKKGTGLGLSVSYFIITEEHRGEMEVISIPGKGTTFVIRLPLS